MTIAIDSRAIRVKVPSESRLSEKVRAVAAATAIVCAFVALLIFLKVPQFTSLPMFVEKTLLGALCGIPLFFLLRGVIERQFAEQAVIVAAGRLTATTSTKWWTRNQIFNTWEIASVAVRTLGKGREAVVEVETGDRRYRVLGHLAPDEASRIALQLKRSCDW